MATIAECLTDAEQRLTVDSARLDAELLLAHALGCSRAFLYTWPERHLDCEQYNVFARLLEQRVAGQPIAYLIGQQEFWSLQLHVNPSVLIPRPETEHLVETALSLYRADIAIDVFDMGTGSGAIALALAHERPTWRLHAVDRSPAALEMAQQNAARLGLNNVRFYHSDWFAGLPQTLRADMIISNPPYLAKTDPHRRQGDLRFEPQDALIGGDDGLAAIRHLLVNSPPRLKPNGHLLLEHGYDQAQAVQTLFAQAGFACIGHVSDLAGHLRLSYARHSGHPDTA